MVSINAKFDGKTFVPDKIPEGLAPNTNVTVILPSVGRPTCFSAIIGIAKDANLPADFSAQHEHYTKGTN